MHRFQNAGKTTVPLQDSRWVWPSHALALNMQSLRVWIVAIRVTFSATAVQYCANDRVCYSPRLIVSN